MEQERISVPKELVDGKPAEHYVLRVIGDSMIAEGILDGDFVIVLRRPVAETGEMVVARIGDEATLRRFYIHHDGRVRLMSAHPKLDPIYVAPEELTIDGIVVGLMRRLRR